ncbi:class I SAM-dependent rRNA methyltransferase [Urbifossiella limnaea]|uniref:Ribosomal RNA large subunit methyltransferase I n=1 Tax=Urbifossiella limnaea TaxID=2528023 RepID=A0A517XQY8_9BACT|nr:class I SAM-dependent rRNA methyltransferase [Urbifossiella limnaea]QDU19927.1 Ribosomal RNA large subunit methyltransferase I [Urbifossiella limnaea]
MDAAPLPTVTLKIERRSQHPWVFQKMLERPAARIPPGSVVEVRDRAGQWVGRAFYNGHSRITLRMLTTDADEHVDAAFFAKKIAAAVAFRRDVLKLDADTDAYRLIHSEADGLSGLVVDRFADTIVVEFFSAGMFKQRDTIRAALAELFPGAKFYWFAEEHVGKQESFDCRPPEPPPPGVITEHGLKFRVAPGSKHKTGFFVDQRDNRRTLASFCSGKRVLDLCCNTGGFSVYAKALGGAADVTGVDLDETAIELAKQNAKLNGVQARFVQADLFSWIRDVLPNGEKFDVVVLDPAKLTRDRETVDLALKKYCDMNRLALHTVAPGGVFLTCSCTGLVSENDFLESVRRAAWQAGRQLQVFKVSGAGPDHPFLLSVPEGRYLKAVFARVE